jgi:transcription antitermination factor NusA-like protein
MKLKLVVALLCLCGLSVTAQVQLTNGPALENDRDNKMNRMLGGDENSFYCYRIRSKGKGTSFFVEKYDKKTLKPVFSKEVNLGEENQTKIEDVRYCNGNVFIFRRQYDKKADKMTLFFQTVSSNGDVSNDLKEVIAISSDHFEFVDFDIFSNPSQTKFIIKTSHKANKDDQYKTDFILMDGVAMKKVWTKTVNYRLSNSNFTALSSVLNLMGAGFFAPQDDDHVGFIGLTMDDKDNIYYCKTDLATNSTEKEKKYKLKLYTLNAADQTPKELYLPFDDDYYVSDVEFLKSNEGEMVVGGCLKDVIERKGRDLVKCGIFSFKVDLAGNTIKAKTAKFFDDAMLAALESNPRRSRYYKYKLDYIFPVGGAVYYVGEQYHEQRVTERTQYSTTTYWRYEYMDVIIGKLGSNGEFEWIKNVPLRINIPRVDYRHVFKQYIAMATNSGLYILTDDHPKNMERYEKPDFEPKDLKSVTGIHGSNFVCNKVDLGTGKVTRSVVFNNEDYCFAPIQEKNPSFMPPEDTEIFVKSKGSNEVYIYTEDRGKDRFAKMIFE